ncbi:hypothetical protein [Streptomyces sp. SS8]
MKRLPAVQTARRVLEDAAALDFAEDQAAPRMVGRMSVVIERLLELLEEQPAAERLAVQHGEELANLNRAVDVELGAIKGAAERLARFETARRVLLAPKGEQR